MSIVIGVLKIWLLVVVLDYMNQQSTSKAPKRDSKKEKSKNQKSEKNVICCIKNCSYSG
jgi:hypothetical protein